MWMWIGLPDAFRSLRRRLRRRRAGANGGFTLLEVLVAFTVLALLMTVLLRIFSDGFRGMTAAEVHAAATLHAQTALASVGTEIPLGEGEWNGVYDDGFRWRVAIQPYGEPGLIVPPRTFIAYRVVAAVDGRHSGGVTLTTLRLASASLVQPDEDADVAQ